MASLGEFVNYQRDKAGLSQEGLGRLVDISQKQISNIESNYIKQPHRSTLKRLAKALNCSYEKLLTLAGYQSNWQEAEILIDNMPLDEKIEEIVEKTIKKETGKAIEEIGKKIAALEQKFILSPCINGKPAKGSRKIPLLTSGSCGSLTSLIQVSEELVEIPSGWNADFAFVSQGQSMEIYKIFDGSTVYVKKQDISHPEDIAVIQVNRGEENYLVIKKCKGDSENQIFLDSKGNIFRQEERDTVIGKVTRVLTEF